MWNIFTRDTAAQRKIERLEGRLEVMADEKADAFELIRKQDAELQKLRVEAKHCLTAHASLLHTAEAMERENMALRQEVADQTRNAAKLGQKLTETKRALDVECDRANEAHMRLYSYTGPRRRDPRGRFLPLRDMGTAA